MARGWESKSVEEQQAQVPDRSAAPRPQLTPEQRALLRKQEGLLLSRKQVEQQLQQAVHPARRQMLEAALAEIDRQLAKMG